MKVHLCMQFCLHILFITCFQVSDLISKIQEAYVETLEELSWMDAPSKEKAREKVWSIANQWFSFFPEKVGVYLQ